jgi:hypothetical protein
VRKATLALFLGVALMVLAMRVFQIDGEHPSSDSRPYYRVISWLGPIVIFLGFIVFTAASLYFSVRLPAVKAIIAGAAFLVVAAIAWNRLIRYAGMDNWTMVLIVPPLIVFLSGALLVLVGGARWIRKIARAQPR